MLVFETFGGLGNQMFYYATARALSERLGVPFIIYNNPITLKEGWQHEIGLHHLNTIDFDIIADLSTLNNNIKWVHINCIHTHLDSVSLPKSENIFFSHTWMGEKTFEFIKDQLKIELKVKTPPNQKNAELISELKSVNSVGVHVRNYIEIEGTSYEMDYCGNNYYNKAINIVNSKVKDPVFYIFCLEMDWCKENFKIDGNAVYVDLNNLAYEEIRLMYSCKHFIGSRSTMSWWAIYLHENEYGIKIYPSFIKALNENPSATAPIGSIPIPHDDIITYNIL